MNTTRNAFNKRSIILLVLGFQLLTWSCNSGLVAQSGLNAPPSVSFSIPDTGQTYYFDEKGVGLAMVPAEGESGFGQDAQYTSRPMSYRDNGDGTVTDLVTGLMWQQDPGDKKSFAQTQAELEDFELAGYRDWRLPTITELYSLIHFNGVDPSAIMDDDISGIRPFIDTDFFHVEYGDPAEGDRIIDSQFLSSTIYVSTTMGNNPTMFGVNFVDGRIKGYPYTAVGNQDAKKFFGLYVRGEEQVYGENSFMDNGDGTITDGATGLMWSQADFGGMNWQSALTLAEASTLAGYDDWRLPNAKELQALVDYSRSPDTSNSAAIDPLFSVTPIENEAGELDYPFYWTGTTHLNSINGLAAVYVSFGRALGFMDNPRTGDTVLMDVHGAGAQRSDPKSGDPSDLPAEGHGPQGDVQRILNYVRLVRDVDSEKEGSSTRTSSGKPVPAFEGMPRSRTAPAMPGVQGGEHPADLRSAAHQLGISEMKLRQALGDPQQGRPNLRVAAQKLGVPLEDLENALGIARPKR